MGGGLVKRQDAPWSADRQVGSWDDRPGGVRSAVRDWNPAGGRSFDVGFRLAQDL